MAKEIQYLSKKLLDFEKRFDSESTDKAIALDFASYLQSLANHIRSCYTTDASTGVIDLTMTVEHAILEVNAQGHVNSSSKSSAKSSSIPPLTNSNGGSSTGEFALLDISQVNASALLMHNDVGKQEKLDAEAIEIVKNKPKSPSTSCGMGYSGTTEEKHFSDSIRKIIQEKMPALKLKRDVFHYMAFATLDRFFCLCSRGCSNKPDMLNEWIKPADQKAASPSQLMKQLPSLITPTAVQKELSNVINADQVYQLLKKKSFEWDSIGRELRVDFKFREQLRKEGGSTSSDSKLERVLGRWIETKCSEPSWTTIIRILEELGFNDLAEDVKGRLRYPKKKALS